MTEGGTGDEQVLRFISCLNSGYIPFNRGIFPRLPVGRMEGRNREERRSLLVESKEENNIFFFCQSMGKKRLLCLGMGRRMDYSV